MTHLERSGAFTLVCMTAGLLIAAAIVLVGCAQATKTYLPDGRQGHSISCDGSGVGMNYCFEKAGELCGTRGYDLIGRSGQSTPAAMATGSGFVYGSIDTKSILVACK
jgi:hypothetical protein